MTSVSSEGYRRGRSLERLVWGAAAAVIGVSSVFASTKTASATAVSALFCAANFSLGRWSLQRALIRSGPGRLGYGALFVSKFALLVAVLGILTLRLKLALAGLLLGFSVLPLALSLLLARELFARKKE